MDLYSVAGADQVPGMDRRDHGYILSMKPIIQAVYTDKERNVF